MSQTYHYDSTGERFRFDGFTDLTCPKCGMNRLRWNGKWFCVGWTDIEETIPCDWSQYRDKNRTRIKAFKMTEDAWALEKERMSH